MGSEGGRTPPPPQQLRGGGKPLWEAAAWPQQGAQGRAGQAGEGYRSACGPQPHRGLGLGLGLGPRVPRGGRWRAEDAQGSRQGPDHFFPADTPEPPEAMLSPMSIDSATSADTTLDTTGDVTVEDVKDFLG